MSSFLHFTLQHYFNVCNSQEEILGEFIDSKVKDFPQACLMLLLQPKFPVGHRVYYTRLEQSPYGQSPMLNELGLVFVYTLSYEGRLCHHAATTAGKTSGSVHY